MSFLYQNRVMRLNNQWKPIGVTTPEKAFIAMSRERQKHYTERMKRPYCALNIEYPVLSDNSYDFSSPISIIPVEWMDWLNLPVRSFDAFIQTPNKRIRIPTVIISNNFSKIPQLKVSYSKRAIWERDGGRCGYTNEELTRGNSSIDHVIPISKGGKTDFTNTLLCKKEINSLKSDLMPDEFFKKYGYKPLKIPVAPVSKRLVIRNTFDIQDWKFFLD